MLSTLCACNLLPVRRRRRIRVGVRYGCYTTASAPQAKTNFGHPIRGGSSLNFEFEIKGTIRGGSSLNFKPKLRAQSEVVGPLNFKLICPGVLLHPPPPNPLTLGGVHPAYYRQWENRIGGSSGAHSFRKGGNRAGQRTGSVRSATPRKGATFESIHNTEMSEWKM